MKTIKLSKVLCYIAFFIIMMISLLDMYNAKFLSSLYDMHLVKQFIWFVCGFAIILICQKVNTSYVFKYSYIFYILSILLLALVLVVGKNINGARAWFDLGFFSFQPSELAKVSLALFLSKLASNFKGGSKREELLFIIKVIILTTIPSVLVFLEPDTGAIVYFFLIAAAVLWVSKIHRAFLGVFLGGLLLVLGVFITLYFVNKDLLISVMGTSFFYRAERIISFKTQNSYQLENALIAIGAAGFWGSGPSKVSIYIPEAPTDFVFAFTISNFGLITGILVLLCYIIIDVYLIKKINFSKMSAENYLLVSFIFLFIFGQIINVGMNLGLVPIIGIPLPFLSYGGSTLITYFLFLGLTKEKNHKMV